MIYRAATLPCRIKNFIVGLDVRSRYHLDLPQMAETRLLIDVAKHLYAGDDGFLIKLGVQVIWIYYWICGGIIRGDIHPATRLWVTLPDRGGES